MTKVIVGVDIGGTSIKIGLIQPNGTIIDKWEIPTNKTNNGKFIIEEIWASIENKISEKQWNKECIYGIGVGAPAFIDVKTSRVIEAVNIGWKNVNVVERLRKKANVPVYIENDANTAALGEYWRGSGQGAKNLLVVTIGTGIGGGIITDGTLLNGDFGMAGEIGHIKIEESKRKCSCGGIGCFETLCSATGIKWQALQLIDQHPEANIASIYRKDGDISAKQVMDLAKSGDRLCVGIIENTSNILGKVFANIASVINPSKIIIGGGVSKSGDFFLSQINSAFKQYAIPRLGEKCELKRAQLGNDAGILGSAYLVQQELGNNK